MKTNALKFVFCFVVAVLICVAIGSAAKKKAAAKKPDPKKAAAQEDAKKKVDKRDVADKLLLEKERQKGPSFPGKDPAFLVLPRKTERSTMPRKLMTPEVVKMKDRALEYLASNQDADGGWSDTQFPSNTGVTALVCLAFMAEGSRPNIGKYGKHLSQGLEFLLRNAKDNGIIAGKGSNPLGPMYEHAYATLALLLAVGDFPWHPETRDKLGRGIQAIHESQRLDGGWRYQFSTEGHSDMSVTATMLWVLRTAKKSGYTVSIKTIKKGVRFIERCAEPDGTFRYRYWGLVSSPRLSGTAVIALCQQGDVSHPRIPATVNRIAYEYDRYTVKDLLKRRYFVYGTFYASLGMYVVGDEYWIPFFQKTIRVLKAMQRKDGEFWDEHDNVMYPTALTAIMLQAPYGYLPIYER